MKKGQIREGIVIDVKFPNKGIVKLLPPVSAEPGIPVKEADAGIQAEEQEEYCTIKNGLPGQRISLMITKVVFCRCLPLHLMKYRHPAPTSEPAGAVHTCPFLMKNSSVSRKNK